MIVKDLLGKDEEVESTIIEERDPQPNPEIAELAWKMERYLNESI
jgi:hypothetical protein